MSGGRLLGCLHEAHPLIGNPVTDTEHDAVGILRAVTAETERTFGGTGQTVRIAWLAPIGGGLEWTTALSNIKAVAP